MVKNAADAQSPLLTASERVDRAIQKITEAQTFTSEQLDGLNAFARISREIYPSTRTILRASRSLVILEDGAEPPKYSTVVYLR